MNMGYKNNFRIWFSFGMQKEVLENIFYNSKMTYKKYYSKYKINFSTNLFRKLNLHSKKSEIFST